MAKNAQIEIQIEGLHKSFNGHTVLQDINLDFYSGEFIAIVGGSGCGKTVLLNCILDQYPIDNGVIRILDRSSKDWVLKSLDDFSELEIDDIHKHWGVVFQRNALFSGSVLFNIALWLKEIKGMDDDAVIPIAKKALLAVGLPDDEDFMNKSASDLSGGMAKRLAIARAISMDPYVYFYDEPTTGLDPISSSTIHNLIFDIHGTDRTSIIITHDKDLLVRLRPRTIMLHEGKVHFDGPFDEFETSQSDVIRPYFETMPLLHKRVVKDVKIEPQLENRKGLVV